MHPSPPTLRPGLYAIVDPDALGGRDALAFARRLLAAGKLGALQLRAKSLGARDVLGLARTLAQLCRDAHTPFFVNDRADLAQLSGATGVHVGQDDLSPADVRAAFPTLALGYSTHSVAQCVRALGEPGDYVAIGPVFPTRSKNNPDPVVGLDELAKVVASVGGARPVVAIGGITLERAREVRAAGATAGAVIAALCVADGDVTANARAIHLALGGEP